MDKLELKCAEVPDHVTSAEPVENGSIDLCVLVGSTRNRNRHTRDQAEQLRDWLNEYLAQPTPEEIALAQELREACLGFTLIPFQDWDKEIQSDWLRVARAAREVRPVPEKDPRIAAIRELVKPIAVADLLENGPVAPRLLLERIRRIREVLEGRDNG